MGCKTFFIKEIDDYLIDALINELVAKGSSVQGNNPWLVDLNQHGIKIKAEWLPEKQELEVLVSHKNIYVPCSKVETEMRSKVEAIRISGDDLPVT
jgi:hypothetical protein